MAVLALSLLAACRGAETPAPTGTAAPAAFPVTITDSAGRQVAIPAPPQRIVALAPNQVEVLFAIGAGDRVVAVEKNTDFPPEAAKPKKIAAYPFPNLEEVVALNPDLVMVSFSLEAQKVPEMERRGLRVLFLDAPKTVEGVFDQIATVGRATGRLPEAEALVASMRQRIGAVEGRLRGTQRGPRTFYELDPTLFTAAPNSFIGDMLRILKVQNLAEGAPGDYPQLSAEAIIARDPEIILLGDHAQYGYGQETQETVKRRPGWGAVTAVRTGRIYAVHPDLISRPGPRIADGLEALARLLYPELFR